ncbi:MAG: OmpA family protein [Tropicimonas sp.]|uniref:OmpA family protein n=1 Tax=Tropicimonas sp. TaxID=2067044 RepID=UPI003A841D0C
MRLGPKIISTTAVILAALLCWLTATIGANIIEDRSGHAVSIALIEGGHDWAEVETDGLQVHIGGTAPSEARRFNALHIAGRIVDAARVVDGTNVQPDKPLTPPDFSIQILRNDEGITLIGLVPASLDRSDMVNEITALADGKEVIDLLQAAHYPVPRGWEAAVHYGMNLLARLPNSKISIAPRRIDITAIARSAKEKAAMERLIEEGKRRRGNQALEVSYQISAPRPVITPFTLRFVIDGAGASFDACSADTPRTRERILAAARKAGLEIAPGREDAACTLGLGVPSTQWADAVTQGIAAVAEFGGGSVTFSDADVTLEALESTDQALFDRVVGALESNLPEVFSLHSIKPEPTTETDGQPDLPPEFSATLSTEGQVQLRGRLNNALVRETVVSFARARFGAEAVYAGARIDESLPDGWPLRVLAALQALAELEDGSAVVKESFISIRGNTGNPEAQAEIARLLSEKLGDGQRFGIDVTYVEALDPVAALPEPEECIAEVNALLAETKISFEPGSHEIAGSAVGVINDIAEVLKSCREVEMKIEIAGHTDSQGREEMNLALSQGRAEAVLEALMARRVLTGGITARGYGESEPIADNDTEEGREINRRIELRLLSAAAETPATSEAGTTTDATEPAVAEPDTTEAGADTPAGPEAAQTVREAPAPETGTGSATEAPPETDTSTDTSTGTATDLPAEGASPVTEESAEDPGAKATRPPRRPGSEAADEAQDTSGATADAPPNQPASDGTEDSQ